MLQPKRKSLKDIALEKAAENQARIASNIAVSESTKPAYSTVNKDIKSIEDIPAKPTNALGRKNTNQDLKNLGKLDTKDGYHVGLKKLINTGAGREGIDFREEGFSPIAYEQDLLNMYLGNPTYFLEATGNPNEVRTKNWSSLLGDTLPTKELYDIIAQPKYIDEITEELASGPLLKMYPDLSDEERLKLAKKYRRDQKGSIDDFGKGRFYNYFDTTYNEAGDPVGGKSSANDLWDLEGGPLGSLPDALLKIKGLGPFNIADTSYYNFDPVSMRMILDRTKKYGGKVSNIPTWNYPSKGTPIYRDTTEVPPNTFASGGFMGQHESKTPFEHMMDSRSNNSKIVQENLEAEVYKGPKLYEEGLETPHMEFTAQMIANEEGEPDKDKKRLKQNKEHLTHRGGVEKETMSFYNELVAIFPELRVTSGKRTGKEGAGKSAGKSRHVRGQAIDIGKEHADIYYWLMNTEQGLALLDKYNMGVLDETNPKILSKTLSDRQKGSGTEEELLKHAHFHIGMDSTIAPTAKARLKELRETGSITELRAYINKNPEHKKVVNVLTDEQKVSITLLPEGKRKNLLNRIQHGAIINHEQIDTELRKELANPNPQVNKVQFHPTIGQTPKFGQGSIFGQGHLFKKHGGNLFANGRNPDIKINY